MNLTHTAPAVTDHYPTGWLVGQLPVGMHDDDLLVRFTTIFERLGTTLRAGADGVEHVADPTVTSPTMLAYLGRWLGYDVLDEGLPIAQQRRIIAALGAALPRRGTAVGLRILLEAITDGPVEIDDCGAVVDDEQPLPDRRPVTIRVSGTGHLRLHELVAIVRDEVPAHLAVDVVVDPDTGDAPADPETAS